MIFLNIILPVILYILAAILLVVLIVLVIKLIKTVTKVNEIADDVELKMKTFDNLFNFVDILTDKLAFLGDKAVDAAIKLITNLFNKKNKNKKESEEN